MTSRMKAFIVVNAEEKTYQLPIPSETVNENLYPWRDYILLPSRVKRCRVIATLYFSLNSTCLNICLLYFSRNNHVTYRITKLYPFHIPCTNWVNSNREGKILWVWCGEFFLYEIKSTSNKCKKGMWDLILTKVSPGKDLGPEFQAGTAKQFHSFVYLYATLFTTLLHTMWILTWNSRIPQTHFTLYLPISHPTHHTLLSIIYLFICLSTIYLSIYLSSLFIYIYTYIGIYPSIHIYTYIPLYISHLKLYKLLHIRGY